MSPVCVYMYLYLTLDLGNFILQRVGPNWLQSFESAIIYQIQNKNFLHIFSRVPCLLFDPHIPRWGTYMFKSGETVTFCQHHVLCQLHVIVVTVHICKDFHESGER